MSRAGEVTSRCSLRCVLPTCLVASLVPVHETWADTPVSAIAGCWIWACLLLGGHPPAQNGFGFPFWLPFKTRCQQCGSQQKDTPRYHSKVFPMRLLCGSSKARRRGPDVKPLTFLPKVTELIMMDFCLPLTKLAEHPSRESPNHTWTDQIHADRHQLSGVFLYSWGIFRRFGYSLPVPSFPSDSGDVCQM